MPISFSFASNTLVTPTYLPLGLLTRGAASGVNDPSQRSALASAQVIESAGDVDVFAVTLLAGQRYTFDVDGGAGDASGGSVDLELDLIDSEGRIVINRDGAPSVDSGSFSTLDPLLTVNVSVSGTYFVAVHSQGTEYVDGTFGFDTSGTGIGDYRFVLSTPSLPSQIVLGSGSDSRAYGDSRQNVNAGGGNDYVSLAGGSDVAFGGSGADRLVGGSGSDELAGGSGSDRLDGGTGDDVLVGGGNGDVVIGGADDDTLFGGGSADRLTGGSGDDRIWGEGGNDVIGAGTGDDFIRGGTGVDQLAGGTGADVFHFLPGEAAFDGSSARSEDRIRDFSTTDLIDFSDLVLGALTFRGASGYSGAGQVRVVDYRNASGDGYQEVRVNLDDDGASELAVLVDTVGNFTLNRSDFEL